MNDIETFINSFITNQGKDIKQIETIRLLFHAGYCWHFAHMLKTTFNRGMVVWAAPYGHICFQDINGNVYDIEGRRDIKDDETYYYIPELYLGSTIDDFKHTETSHNTSSEELIEICKEYCLDEGITYDSSIEIFFTKKDKK